MFFRVEFCFLAFWLGGFCVGCRGDHWEVIKTIFSGMAGPPRILCFGWLTCGPFVSVVPEKGLRLRRGGDKFGVMDCIVVVE